MTIYDGRLQHDQRFGDPGLPCLALPRCSVVDESMRLGPDPAVINSKSANHRPSECHQSLFWQTRSGRYFPIEINLRLCLISFAKQDLKHSLIQSRLASDILWRIESTVGKQYQVTLDLLSSIDTAISSPIAPRSYNLVYMNP